MSFITLTASNEKKNEVDEIYNDPRIQLNIDDLSFTYSVKKGLPTVIKDITIDIQGAQLVSILGPNGVGKSTFIHCINKILDPTAGAVFINDCPVKTIPLKSMARLTGYVPYSANDSFPLSVTDTVLMGRHPHSKMGSIDDDLLIVEETLKLMGIEDLADRMFNELSAGQHQKVMLARGLAQQPKILLLDEPTSNLDIRFQLEITRMLRNLSRSKNMLVIMISHDINIAAKYSDNIIMLKDGGIYAVGRPSEVVTAENLRHVYDIDVKVIEDCDRPHIILVDDKFSASEEDCDGISVICGKHRDDSKTDSDVPATE